MNVDAQPYHPQQQYYAQQQDYPQQQGSPYPQRGYQYQQQGNPYQQQGYPYQQQGYLYDQQQSHPYQQQKYPYQQREFIHQLFATRTPSPMNLSLSPQHLPTYSLQRNTQMRPAERRVNTTANKRFERISQPGSAETSESTEPKPKSKEEQEKEIQMALFGSSRRVPNRYADQRHSSSEISVDMPDARIPRKRMERHKKALSWSKTVNQVEYKICPTDHFVRNLNGQGANKDEIDAHHFEYNEVKSVVNSQLSELIKRTKDMTSALWTKTMDGRATYIETNRPYGRVRLVVDFKEDQNSFILITMFKKD